MSATTIFWTARNDNSYLNGCRQASSMRAAVRAARQYVTGELFGWGTIYYYAGEPNEWGRPVRVDAKRSAYERWSVSTWENGGL